MRAHEVVAISLLTLIVIAVDKGSTTTCGQRSKRPVALIANGLKANEGDWPWHAAIFHLSVGFNVQYQCGGTVITSSAVLTAAHCVHEDGRRIIADRILVDLGKHILTQFTHAQQFTAYRVTVHPNYVTSDLTNDIAIITLATEATFNNYVQPICLWDSSDTSDVAGKFGTVVGWGRTEERKLANVLRQASVPIVPSSTCTNQSTTLSQYLTERTFCAGYLNGTSICNGDSGGGLVFEENGVYRIRGIVSLTTAASDTNNCSSQSYVVFTDIARYLDWIQEVVPRVETFLVKSGEDNWTYAKINCKFGWNESDKRYECVDRTFQSTANNTKISTAEGAFYDGKTYSDVNTVILSGTSTTYIPDMSVLRNKFENFDRLFIVNSGLKYVERRKLRVLPQLQILNFYGNNIESFDEDILYDLPQLEIFAFVQNSVSVLPKSLLTRQTKLKEFWAWNNQIEAIPQDFFVNNKELTHVWFSANSLTKIDVNFNQLPRLAVLDLRQNGCISEQACNGCNYSVADVQSLVERNCNGLFRNNLKLKEIYASENQIKTIAVDFVNLPNLVEFDVSGNQCINEFCLTENFCHTDSREKMQEKIWQKCKK